MPKQIDDNPGISRRSLIGSSALLVGGVAALGMMPRFTQSAQAATTDSNDFYVGDYGAVGDGVTDDTGAIQSAIDAAYTYAASGSGYARVLFGATTYQLTSAPSRPIPGALNACAQLLIPLRTTGPLVNLELVGAGSQQGVQDLAGLWQQAGGTRLRSTVSPTWGGQSTGLPPAVIAAQKGSDWGGFSRVTVAIQGIAIMVSPNPSIAGINLLWAPQVQISGVRISTSDDLLSVTEPTNTWATALVLPYVSNNAVVYVRMVSISGFYTGVLFSEHTDASSILIFGCQIAYSPAGVVAHTSRFGLASAEWCPTIIGQTDWEEGLVTCTGDNIIFNLLDIEEFNGAGTETWATQGDYIYDPNSLLHGWIWLNRISRTTLTLLGAANLQINQLYLT